MWQRFTERARRVVYFAQEDARARNVTLVNTEHLLMGILKESDSTLTETEPGKIWPPPPRTEQGQHSWGYQMLAALNIAPADVQAGLAPHLTSGDKSPTVNDMQLTPASKRVIDLAYEEARRLRHTDIGTEHILLGLIRDKVGVAGQVLAALGADLELARQMVTEMQSTVSPDNTGSWLKTLFGRK